MSTRILSVDDSPSIRRMVVTTIKMGGYDVIEAVDGADGLEKALATPVDLIVTDQNMPNMDGLTLARHLRATELYAHTPILMLTTESSDEMKAAGRAAGLSGWMVKPFNPQTLLDVIARLLA